MAKEQRKPAKRTMRGVQLISENAINNLKDSLAAI